MPAHLKPAFLRQRSNKASTRATLVCDGTPWQHAPRLPSRVRDWRRETRAWWRDVWASDLARDYQKVDMHGLFRLAILIDMFAETRDVKLAREIRVQSSAYGLTPLDRMRLGVAMNKKGIR